MFKRGPLSIFAHGGEGKFIDPDSTERLKSVDPDIECEVLQRSEVFVVRHVATGAYLSFFGDTAWLVNKKKPRYTFYHNFGDWGPSGKWDAFRFDGKNRAIKAAESWEKHLTERRAKIAEAFVEEVRVWR